MTRRWLTSLPVALLAVAPDGARAADVVVQLGAGDAFVIENNTGTIERLRVDEATGNISRNGALFLFSPGSNLFIGEGAGDLGNTGTQNSAFGRSALSSNIGGSLNAAFGGFALASNVGGNANSAFGSGALSAHVDGWHNSAFGQLALTASNGERTKGNESNRTLRGPTQQRSGGAGRERNPGCDRAFAAGNASAPTRCV